MDSKVIAEGKVKSICINGEEQRNASFALDGPRGDTHQGFSRRLSGHDGEYRRTSKLDKGASVFNWRSWTGLSSEENTAIEEELGVTFPPGCLLENIVVSGIPSFSRLSPTTRLVFPSRKCWLGEQVILAIWEQNDPCRTVGDRLEKHHGIPGLMTRFVAAAKDRRGVMGFVLAAGKIEVEDTVLVYPPVT
jgi:hypothetical protein